jgi:hypothetical protein
MTSSRLIATLFTGALALGAAAPAHACWSCYSKMNDIDGVATDLPKPPPSKLATPGGQQQAPFRICSWQSCNGQSSYTYRPPASSAPDRGSALKKQFAGSPRR